MYFVQIRIKWLFCSVISENTSNKSVGGSFAWNFHHILNSLCYFRKHLKHVGSFAWNFQLLLNSLCYFKKHFKHFLLIWPHFLNHGHNWVNHCLEYNMSTEYAFIHIYMICLQKQICKGDYFRDTYLVAVSICLTK